MSKGQTFALVHLVELLMALLVIVLAAVGLVALVSSIAYYEQFYAKDNAYVLEALHAVPNGDVQFGYLWASPNYVIQVQSGSVTVSKVTSKLQGFIHGTSFTKAYGTDSSTRIEPAKIQPQYLRYSLAALPSRVITTAAQLAATSCSVGIDLTGVQVAEYNDPNTDLVGADIAKDIVEQTVAAEPKLAKTGLTLFVIYQPASVASITVYDRAQSPLTAGVTCALQRGTGVGLSVTQDSIANVPNGPQNVKGDIVILVKGLANDRTNIENTIVQGFLSYVHKTAQAPTLPTPPAPTPPPAGKP